MIAPLLLTGANSMKLLSSRSTCTRVHVLNDLRYYSLRGDYRLVEHVLMSWSMSILVQNVISPQSKIAYEGDIYVNKLNVPFHIIITMAMVDQHVM